MAIRRLWRQLLVALGAATLLWIGLGSPHRPLPPYQSERIAAADLRLRALAAGKGDTTLLFLHGYGESLLSWRYVLDRFPRHYRVLAVDLPGFGLSDKPDTRYDLDAYRRWLGDLVARQTRGPLIVVGHSMGGELAAALALDHPGRIVAVVLIAPAGAGISSLLSDSDGVVSPASLWVASALSYVLPAHDSAWFRETAQDLAYSAAEDSLAMAAARRVLEEFDFAALADRFRDLRQPVLLIWGRQDPTIPFEIGERIAAELPCRRFLPLTALHRPHQTAPDTVAAEIERFVRRPGCATSAP